MQDVKALSGRLALIAMESKYSVHSPVQSSRLVLKVSNGKAHLEGRKRWVGGIKHSWPEKEVAGWNTPRPLLKRLPAGTSAKKANESGAGVIRVGETCFSLQPDTSSLWASSHFITSQSLPGDQSPQQQRNPHFHALLNTPRLSAALPLPCITVLSSFFLLLSLLFSCQEIASTRPRLALPRLCKDSLAWAQPLQNVTLREGACRPCLLCIIASGEKRLFAPCWVRWEESDPRCSPPTSPSSRSNWLWVNGRKKSRQLRVSMQEESASSLKKRNGGIGAFSPGGYSTFTTRERETEREKRWGGRGGERKWPLIRYGCDCIYHPHCWLTASGWQFGAIVIQGWALPSLVVVHQLSAVWRTEARHNKVKPQ